MSKKRKKHDWIENLIKVEKIVWDSSEQKVSLPQTIIVNIVTDLGLKSLDGVNVLGDDEGPVYLTDVLDQYLSEKYGCPVIRFELDYVYPRTTE